MTNSPRVAVLLSTDTKEVCFSDNDWARLDQRCDVVICENPEERDASEIHDAMRGARIVMTGWGGIPLEEDVLEPAQDLELWAHAAGSMAPYATDAVWRRNLILTTANSILAEGVAEFALAVTIVGLKQMIPLVNAMRAARQRPERPFPVRELYDIDVGIVGYGQIGRYLHRLLKNFTGLRIFVSDPNVTAEEIESAGALKAELDDICRRCDVIHNCVPWLPTTEGMFGRAQFESMKDNAIFINTGRGATVDEAALADALRSRPIQAYLDVTYPEPPRKDSPLYDLPNCFLTPHIAGCAGNGRRRLGAFAVDEILRFLDGEPLRGQVTRKTVESMTGAKPTAS